MVCCTCAQEWRQHLAVLTLPAKQGAWCTRTNHPVLRVQTTFTCIVPYSFGAAHLSLRFEDLPVAQLQTSHKDPEVAAGLAAIAKLDDELREASLKVCVHTV
jgi:hypothetical protein